MASVQSNGITLEYVEQGSGDPLLLVMGLSGQLIDWPQEFVDLLAEQGFRVIRFDNRDSGLSTEMPGPAPTMGDLAKALVFKRKLSSEYLVSDMADDAIGVLDALGIESAHVVGMSMGGMIAQAMAIQHPSRVRSLTSIMSTTGNRRVGRPRVGLLRRTVRRPKPTLETAIESGLQTFRAVSGPTFDEARFREMAKVSIDRSYRPDGTARQTAAIMSSPDRTDALGRLRLPTLVIHGMLDPLVRMSGGVATARAIPGARLLMFNDMAHDLPSTRWHEMAEAIRRNADRVAAVIAS